MAEHLELVQPHVHDGQADRAFFDFPGGEVLILAKNKEVLTVERAICLLECTKARLLKGLGVV